MEGRGSWPLRGASQLPTLAQPMALLCLASLSPSLGLLGAWDCPLFLTVVAPAHRGTLWPLLHHSPAPQPDDHPTPSSGLIRPALCLSYRPCQVLLTFLPPGVCLTPESHCPHRWSVHIPFSQALASVTLHTCPCSLIASGFGNFTLNFQWLVASEAKPL